MKKDTLEISWATLWRVFFMIIFILIFFLARESLIILFLAIIISSALNPPVSYLQKKKIPRIIGTIIIFLLVLFILAMVLYTVIPIAVFELQAFLSNFKDIEFPVFGIIDFSQFINFEKYLGGLENITNTLFSGSVSFIGVLSSFFGNVALIFATLIISFYMTIDQGGVERLLKSLLPVIHEKYVISIYNRVCNKMGRWFQGQILLMIIIGGITAIGLHLLGVKYALILGILAGLLEIVPIVGPIFAGTLAFLVAIPESFILGIYVIILFLFIQQAESQLLVPLVMKKAVGVSPVVVVIAILAGSQVAGFIGIILAVPAAVVFQEIIVDWEKRKLRTQQLELNE
ncbi:AI-2E family transporter [Candidatus Wolfebacteria bacterium]|nr:AI-2E family transporter [Candidatus Wolfebacteria bacterium]